VSEPCSNRLAALLLPREHGSWSLALEPVALGLLAAPSVSGVLLGLAATTAFLARRPAQFVAGRFGPMHQSEALAPLALLIGCAGVAVAAAGLLGGWAALAPLLLAVPPAALFLHFDTRGESRAAAAELAGAATFAFVTVTCGTLAGRGWPTALALGALSLLRAAPAVLVVRTFLRRQKGQPASAPTALATSLGATAGIAWLAHAKLAHLAVLGVALLLLVRSVWLLGPRPPALRASQLGVIEAVLGAAFVLAAGLGGTI
jgi:hypothetical protein